MKILIIRFSSIGDIVLTTPVIRMASKQLKAKVHFLTKERFADLLLPNPYIDKIITLGQHFDAMIDELKKEKYDYVVDLHHNLRTFRIKSSLKIKSASFFKANIEKWLMVNFKLDSLPKKHIVDRYLDTLSYFNIKNDGKGLDFYYEEEKKLLNAYQVKKPYIALSVGAAHHTKQIPYDLLDKIITQSNNNFVLVGGSDVVNIGEKLGKNHTNCIDLCGKLNYSASAQIIDGSELLLTGDTGMMHIGAALKKPILSIWGNTIPAFGMYPYYGTVKVKHRMIEQKVSCRPCSKTGFSHCPKKHFACMNRHDASIIIDEMVEILKVTGTNTYP